MLFFFLFSSIAYTQSFKYFLNLPLSINTHLAFDLVLASILIAFGYFLALSSGASTVGVEVIALIIIEKYNHLSLSLMIRYLNYLVLSFWFFVYGPQSIVLGLVFTFIYSNFLSIFLKYFK